MADVRKELGVKSIRWKIEKRVLERIGHVMRMDDRMTKAVVLGWLGELENWEKMPGNKRKTVFYWRKLLREAGIDATNLNELTSDRKGWRRKVRKRMKWIEKWEKSQGHTWEGPEMERNQRVVEAELVCDVCGKECKSKAGLVIHRRRMHEVSGKKKEFVCEECEEVFRQEANLLNHKKVCEGAPARGAGRRKCVCGRDFAKSYFGKHRRTCAVAVDAVAAVQARAPRVYKGKKTVCECGRELAKTNLARHKREACPLGDAGS